jgi:hypothetical protein
MEKLQLNDLMRSQYVKRWHIVNTAKSQSLAEHQFNVAMIAATIATKLKANNSFIKNVTILALMHDAPEIVMGDIPTPAKRRGSKEGVFEFKLPFDIHVGDSESARKIVKAADFLDAIHFVVENGVGRHAQLALDDIRRSYKSWLADQEPQLREATQDVEAEIFYWGFVI